VTTVATGWLAPDPAVPARDTLLDPSVAPVPVDADTVEVVRCKYRVGESLRVLYRCTLPTGPQLVSVRASAGCAMRWWRFPDDRRLPGIAALMAPAADVAGLATHQAWVHSELVEYAPERSITVRALDGGGRTTAYAKCSVASSVEDLATRYAHVARWSGGCDVPRPVGWSLALGVLVLEAVPGTPWADTPPDSAVPTAESMGSAIAALHGTPAPPGTTPFGRLALRRIDRSAEVLATARPDVAERARRLARRLTATRVGGPSVLLHGDCHPKNAIVDGDRLTLIDLDQAGLGPAAADIGSLLARVRVGDLVDGGAGEGERLTAAFLAGYSSRRVLPTPESLRWHTAAALLVEQAVRAVNRVRADVLDRLEAVLEAGAELLAGHAR
jgi:aminoglycoside phosphotransferase (APT) family kinase protein